MYRWSHHLSTNRGVDDVKRLHQEQQCCAAVIMVGCLFCSDTALYKYSYLLTYLLTLTHE